MIHTHAFFPLPSLLPPLVSAAPNDKGAKFFSLIKTLFTAIVTKFAQSVLLDKAKEAITAAMPFTAEFETSKKIELELAFSFPRSEDEAESLNDKTCGDVAVAGKGLPVQWAISVKAVTEAELKITATTGFAPAPDKVEITSILGKGAGAGLAKGDPGF